MRRISIRVILKATGENMLTIITFIISTTANSPVNKNELNIIVGIKLVQSMDGLRNKNWQWKNENYLKWPWKFNDLTYRKSFSQKHVTAIKTIRNNRLDLRSERPHLFAIESILSKKLAFQHQAYTQSTVEDKIFFNKREFQLK